MGFNKRILPSKVTLQNMVFDYGVAEVVGRYKKVDMLIGDSGSMVYLEQLIKEYESTL
jgi:hypothetical protein